MGEPLNILLPQGLYTTVPVPLYIITLYCKVRGNPYYPVAILVTPLILLCIYALPMRKLKKKKTLPLTYYYKIVYLLDVKLHYLNACVFPARPTMVACSDLQVISGGLGEGLHEPGRVVELAAGAAATTPSTIPQRVI